MYTQSCTVLYIACPLTSGYAATAYELLQMPHSTESSQCSSAILSRPDSQDASDPFHHPAPPQPLQLGRLTSELYKLHSSSTHSLSPKHYLEKGRKCSLPALGIKTKSLEDLSKLGDPLDAFTQPSVSITRRGKGTFRELLLPPPIIPLPKIKKPKAVSQSQSSSGRQMPKTPTKTSPPKRRSLSRANSRQQLFSPSPSPSATSPPQTVLSSSSSRSREGAGEEALGGKSTVTNPSKATQKLLQNRAKLCTPGETNYIAMQQCLVQLCI